MKQAVLAFALLAVVALGALLLTFARGARDRAPDLSDARETLERTPTPAEFALPPAVEPEMRNAVPVFAVRAPADEESSTLVAGNAPVAPTLSGTIAAIDELGVEHRREDGRFVLVLAGGRTFPIEVRDGCWHAQLVAPGPGEEGGSIGVAQCELGGRPAVLEEVEEPELSLPADGHLDLRVRWIEELLLHVRARDTGLELEDVRIHELPIAARGSLEDREHPGLDAHAKEHEVGPSPVHIDARQQDWLGPHVFFARSPGYAWGRIEIDARKSEEHTLLLDPAGELELFIRGEPWVQWAEIELYASGDLQGLGYLDMIPGRVKSILLSDLPAGLYTAQARHDGLLFGSVDAEVLAEERVIATLELEPPSSKPVPFEGVLVLPAEWGTDDFVVDFCLMARTRHNGYLRSEGSFSFRIHRSEMQPEVATRDQFRWATLAQAGRYTVFLPSFKFEVEVDTGPKGTRDARIEVPPPGDISVRCVDELSGAEVKSEKVLFVRLSPGFYTEWSSSPSPDFRAPQGRIRVSTRPNLYEGASRVVDVGPGRTAVVLRLRRKQ